jgi:hypothetical protein
LYESYQPILTIYSELRDASFGVYSGVIHGFTEALGYRLNLRTGTSLIVGPVRAGHDRRSTSELRTLYSIVGSALVLTVGTPWCERVYKHLIYFA